MANHKSAEKRIRTNNRKRLENRYYAKTMRNALKDFRLTTDKTTAESKISHVTSLIDKLAKKGIIHANKAANLKSGMMKKVNNMQ
ncbi:MAG: 30S ribosomal protein S20 [Bacteroidales bacterium]|jgi:small subunit ribosomal protein S20|nr:30S ribosomal protein S20 [Bacteroidales bacterium]